MSIRINLTTFGYSLDVPKEGLLKLRGSLFAQAIETEPEVKSIDITNPVVKPEHLVAIAKMARQEKLDTEMKVDSKEAAQYLNWPLLDAIRNPLYTDCLELAPTVDIYRPETYGSLLVWSVRLRFQALTQHILQVTDSSPVEGQAFVLAAHLYNISAIRELLSRQS